MITGQEVKWLEEVDVFGGIVTYGAVDQDKKENLRKNKRESRDAGIEERTDEEKRKKKCNNNPASSEKRNEERKKKTKETERKKDGKERNLQRLEYTFAHSQQSKIRTKNFSIKEILRGRKKPK